MANSFGYPWAGALLADEEIATLWSDAAQLEHCRRFEAAYSRALGAHGLAGADIAERAAQAIEGAALDGAAVKVGVLRDGLPIPAFVDQLKAAAGPDAAAVHRGATSQDVMDSALALTAQAINDPLTRRAEHMVEALADLESRFGAASLMGRTRMQAALEIRAGDRIAVWRQGLEDAAASLHAARPGVERLQLGGPVGDGRGFGDDPAAFARTLADALGLAPAPAVWHANRAGVAVWGSALSLITGAMGKIGQDIALMAQQGVDEITLKGGGGSSAMPHKQNPVRAELLVTLARFNAAQLGGLHQALVHEQERSGAAWTLEWMFLPAMTNAAASALRLGLELLESVERICQPGARSS